MNEDTKLLKPIEFTYAKFFDLAVSEYDADKVFDCKINDCQLLFRKIWNKWEGNETVLTAFLQVMSKFRYSQLNTYFDNTMSSSQGICEDFRLRLAAAQSPKGYSIVDLLEERITNNR